MLKATMTIYHKPSSQKKVAQHLIRDPLRSGDHVTTVTGPAVWYSPGHRALLSFLMQAQSSSLHTW